MIEDLEIQKYKASALVEKIDKLNRKAIKIGCPAMTLSFGEDIVKKWDDENGRAQVQVTCLATLEYEIPIIDGWKLISTFDIYAAAEKTTTSLVTEDGLYEPNIVKYIVTTSTVPGETIPAAYLNKDEIHCDHCGHDRRRTHSMLMLNIDTGVYKEVGSTCIRDFFGHDPVAFMRWASWDFEEIYAGIKDDDFEGCRGSYFEDLRETLIFTSATCRKYGWMSKGKAYERGEDWCTADEVSRQMSPRISAKMNADERVTVEDMDREIADATIAHFTNLTDAELNNDYMANCHKMTVLGYVPWKHHGLTVSMVPSAKRAIAEKKAATADTSEYVGNIGDKIKGIEAECVFAKELASDWGPKTLYIFKGTDGNTYKTFYTGDKWGAYEGDIVLLNGTVKSHDEYKGKKATMMTRCFAKVTKDGAPEALEANDMQLAKAA
jgi:hypothetical protein